MSRWRAPWTISSGAAAAGQIWGAPAGCTRFRRSRRSLPLDATATSTDRSLAVSRRKLFRVAQWIFAALVLFFAFTALAGQWNQVGARLLHIQFGWEHIASATVLVLVTYALLIEGWRRILIGWDSHLGFRPAARIWFLSNLGKYVPGNIWSLTAMGVMARERGLSGIAAAGSSIIMQAVSLATGTAIVMVTSAKLLGQPLLVGAAVLLLALGLVMAPRFLPRLAVWAGNLTGREIAPPSIPATGIWTAAIASTASWILYGVAFMLFARGLLGSAAGEVSSYIAVYTAAYILGFISPIAPAGLGVREITLAAFMTQLGLANEADAALVAIAARLWLIVVELVPSGL